MVKAIFFDVDGTLVSMRSNAIPQSTLDSLKTLREQGVKLFVATGRHMSMLDDVRAQFEFDGYITVNGQFCLCGDTVVYSNPIPRAGLEEIVCAMEEHGFSGMFLEGEEYWLNLHDEMSEQFLRDFPVKRPPLQPLSRALEHPVYQVIVMLSPEQEWKLLDTAKSLNATRWYHGFLDALPPDGGKDVGICAVLDRLGIDRSEAMSFGDGENDLTMLSCVGIGVAMGNANEKVKGQADYVTAHVDEDGVRRALEQFGLL